MKTLIRLLLEEQSDLGLHCLPRSIRPNTLGHYGNLCLTQKLLPVTGMLSRLPLVYTSIKGGFQFSLKPFKTLLVHFMV